MTPQEGGAGPAGPHSMLTTPPGLGCALVQCGSLSRCRPAQEQGGRSWGGDPTSRTGSLLLTRLHPQNMCCPLPED